MSIQASVGIVKQSVLIALCNRFKTHEAINKSKEVNECRFKRVFEDYNLNDERSAWIACIRG